MSSLHWFDYVKASYDLVTEAEGRAYKLDHEVEAYVVHLVAHNFERTNIGEAPVAIQLMTAMQDRNKEGLRAVGDECLLIHSYPMLRKKWPSKTYYSDMGMLAYGMAPFALMESNFHIASRVLRVMFNRSLRNDH